MKQRITRSCDHKGKEKSWCHFFFWSTKLTTRWNSSRLEMLHSHSAFDSHGDHNPKCLVCVRACALVIKENQWCQDLMICFSWGCCFLSPCWQECSALEDQVLTLESVHKYHRKNNQGHNMTPPNTHTLPHTHSHTYTKKHPGLICTAKPSCLSCSANGTDPRSVLAL